jgi:hypothetical protein
VARGKRPAGVPVSRAEQTPVALSGPDARQLAFLKEQIPLLQQKLADHDARRAAEPDGRKRKVTKTEAALRRYLKDFQEEYAELNSSEAEPAPAALTKELGLKLEAPPVGAKLGDKASAAVQAGDLRGALRAIAESGSTPLMREVAKKLLSKVGNTRITLGTTAGAGQYNPTTDTITISPDGMHEHTLLHEMVHAAMSHVLRNRFHPLTQQLAKLYQQIAPRLQGQYGAKDVQEFAAEAQTNSDFRTSLQSIQMPQGALKTAWDHFVNAVRKFLGLPPRQSQTTLDKIDKLLNDLLESADAESRTPGDILSNFNQSGGATFNSGSYRPSVIAWAKDHFGERVAPNGKPVWQNFTRWFGDSKAVVKDGSPMVLYRGMDSDYGSTMRVSKDGALGAGIYMTPDPKFAQEYVGQNGNIAHYLPHYKILWLSNIKITKTQWSLQLNLG